MTANNPTSLKELENILRGVRSKFQELIKLEGSPDFSKSSVIVQLADLKGLSFESYTIKVSIESDGKSDEGLIEMNLNSPCELQLIGSKNYNILFHILKKAEAVEEEQKETLIALHAIPVANLSDVYADKIDEVFPTIPVITVSVNDFELSFRMIYVVSNQEYKNQLQKQINELITQKSKLQMQPKEKKKKIKNTTQPENSPDDLPRVQNFQEVEIEKPSSAEVEKPSNAEVEKTPNAKVEKPSNAEFEKTPNAKVEKTPSAKVGKTPSAKVEKTPSAKVEKTPSAKVEKTPSAKEQKSSSQIEKKASVKTEKNMINETDNMEGNKNETSMLSEITSKSVSILQSCWEHRNIGLFVVGVFVVRTYGDHLVL